MNHHPWRWVRDHLPDWHVDFVPLPDGRFGDTNTEDRLIRIDSGLTQAQRRSTIEHERIHARDGDVGPQPAWRERQVDQEAAECLIPFYRLIDACLWATCEAELAEELWVDLDMIRCRLANLTESERDAIRAAQRAAWNDFEQWIPDE